MTAAVRAARRKRGGGRARPVARRREPAQKRARLLEAARRLFAARGYAATTTARLAREAGVAEGTVFHHFPSKRALLEAVASEYGRGLAEHMFAGVDVTAGDPTADRVLHRAFAYVREQGALSRLLAFAPEPMDWSAARAASRREVVSALASVFTVWRGRESMRSFDPQIAAELLFALVEAALAECFVYGDGSREEEYLRETVACVEGALRARSPSAIHERSPS